MNKTFDRTINKHPNFENVQNFLEQKETKQLNVKIDLELYKIAKTKATEQNLKIYQYIEKLIEKDNL